MPKYGNILRNNFESKTFLLKIIMQLKMTYSYPIYYLLSRPQKLKIQDYQNIPIYAFILSNVPHDQLCRVAGAIFIEVITNVILEAVL